MPKQSVVPDALTKPFWDAANNERLVIQNCTACNRLQHPPEPTCYQCGSADHLEWKQMSGKGTIYNNVVIYDSPIKELQADQPYNAAVIMLDEDNDIQMYSHLKGTPLDQVPVGGKVEVWFEPLGNGQKVPEWRIVGQR